MISVGVFEWLNNQLLKMEWLSDLIAVLVENVFGLDVNGRIGGSIHFFIYDFIKIFILLSRPDFCYFLYSKLFSTRKNEANFRKI